MDNKNVIIDASKLTADQTFEADVAIIGTGAGGGFAADVLSKAGLKVIMIDAGGYYQSKDFSQNEGQAFPMLYQEAGAQRTKDNAIAVYQGQAVGGTTVVNWTSSFRTPEKTLAHWQSEFGVSGISENELNPWFEQIEERLNIGPWTSFEPNPNNSVLTNGCAKLGWSHSRMNRNVKGCANTGLCGLGCPINAKQSMLVTTVPSALANGARLIHRARVEKIEHDGKNASALTISAMDGHSVEKTGVSLTVRARHFVAAAGSIRTPGLMMRSAIPDPSGMTGKRTFLHPVTASLGIMPTDINGWKGAPQTTYSDHHLWPTDDKLGFKLEVTPLQPVFALALFEKNFGDEHAAIAKRFNKMNSHIALMRDGFHEGSQGGSIVLDKNGNEKLDYPLTPYLEDGFRRSMIAMMDVQLAAGAKYVLPWHIKPTALRTGKAVRDWVANASFAPDAVQLGSAHVMGGAMMGDDAAKSVVRPDGQHHQISNLSVIDGSIFPTSIGANPQQSIYAFSLRNATVLADKLKA